MSETVKPLQTGVVVSVQSGGIGLTPSRKGTKRKRRRMMVVG